MAFPSPYQWDALGRGWVGTYTGSVGGSVVYLAARFDFGLLSFIFSDFRLSPNFTLHGSKFWNFHFVLAIRTTRRVPDRA